MEVRPDSDSCRDEAAISDLSGQGNLFQRTAGSDRIARFISLALRGQLLPFMP